MKFSQLFAPTLKEVPKDAVLPSHIYLVRAGFVYQVASGIYDFLPLGKRVLQKIEAIIRRELNAAGCQEVQLGFVTPADLWRKSGRFEKYGAELLRFEDRKANDFVLGPTHEEMMVDLVSAFVASYKQLPLHLYQINLKFRDEARPRFGLMRGREFLMKDSYSFHADSEDMVREFNHMQRTYEKIFAASGLDFRVVEADSGAIGGSGSKEFMVLAESGEDTIVVCDACDYAANAEAAHRKAPEPPTEAPEALFARFKTPGVTTIEALGEFFKVDPFFLVKTVAKRALYDEGKSEIVLFALRGSDTLQEVKAQNAVGANELADADDEALAEVGLVPGYMGPVDIAGVKVVADETLCGAKNLICGANASDYHLVGVDAGMFGDVIYDDLAEVREGDRCIRCGGSLKHTKGIEVGHIFQLGTRYSEPLGATYLDQNGKAVPMVMGTYGIGVSRMLAACIEQNHDERGCLWPRAVAPFDVVVIAGNMKEAAQADAARKIYETLLAEGLDVLFDDRKGRFGSKMKDFELIGCPVAVVVGKRLEAGEAEIVVRRTLEKRICPLDALVKNLKEVLA